MALNTNPAHSLRHVPALLTVNDVAEILRVSKRTVESLISSGAIRSINIGRSRRVNQNDLADFASMGTADIIKAGLRAIANEGDNA